jgi:hypothetical protein
LWTVFLVFSVIFGITNYVPYTNTVRVAANHLWTAVHRHLSTVLEAASLARSAGRCAGSNGVASLAVLIKAWTREAEGGVVL